jgi:predicted nuclease with TOPRIM domain
MRELKTMLVSVLTKLETSYRKLEYKIEANDSKSNESYENLQNKVDKLETSYRELGNTLEASHRKTLASFDKVVESFRIASPQIQKKYQIKNYNLMWRMLIH